MAHGSRHKIHQDTLHFLRDKCLFLLVQFDKISPYLHSQISQRGKKQTPTFTTINNKTMALYPTAPEQQQSPRSANIPTTTTTTTSSPQSQMDSIYRLGRDCQSPSSVLDTSLSDLVLHDSPANFPSQIQILAQRVTLKPRDSVPLSSIGPITGYQHQHHHQPGRNLVLEGQLPEHILLPFL